MDEKISNVSFVGKFHFFKATFKNIFQKSFLNSTWTSRLLIFDPFVTLVLF